MLDVTSLNVLRNGQPICHVPKLQIARGECVAILGANGSGKTTLLRVLAGLESNYEGQVHVEVPRSDRGFVHQSPYLFRGTVLSNVLYGLQQRRSSAIENEQKAIEWLDRIGMKSMSDRRVTHLSGGEKRRVAVARAMVLRPQLLLLDEPLSDMDDAGRQAILSAIAGLEDCAVLITSPIDLPSGVATKMFSLSD